MHINKRALSVSAVSLVVTFGVVSLVVAATSFAGQGTVSFDSIQIGRTGVGGVTYFNGSIINDTKASSGADQPIALADNVRIDGRVFRGASQGPSDSQPFIIDDNGQVTGGLSVAGALSAGSITGLSSMVSSAGFAQTSALTGFAKSTDLAAYATLTDLTAYATLTDLAAIELNVALNRAKLIVWGNYLDCVAGAAQYTTYSESLDILACWNTYVSGTPILPPLLKDGTEQPAVSSRPEGPESVEPTLNKK